MKKIVSMMLAICLLTGMTGCGKEEKTRIQVFVAASLHKVMEELANQYEEKHSDVEIIIQADSSGTLMTQIREGYACDLFFSAAQQQMDILQEEGFIKVGTRTDVVNNRVVLIAGKGSKTKVTGLDRLKDAGSIALAGGSVPVGRYTREALVNKGILPRTGDASKIRASQVSEALGGVEISEQDNVSKVLIAVAEGSCEVGTVYYSDIYGYEDRVEILETVSEELTGAVTYPIALVENREAVKAQKQAAEAFLKYVLSDEAKVVLEHYYFDTDVE